MSEISTTPAARPWRDGLTAGIGAALLAGLVVALIDASSAGFATFPTLLALWAPIALGVGIGLGLIVAGFRATFGDGALRAAYRRLDQDRELDVSATGVVMAAAVLAALLVGAVAVLAKTLVAGVQRQGTGALLLGVSVVVLVPVLGMLGLPVYRGTRFVASGVPRRGPPRVLALLGLGVVLLVAAAGHVIFNQLDWRALGLGGYLLFLGVPAGALLVLAVTARWRPPIPAKGAVAAAGAVIAALLPAVVLRGAPGAAVRDAVVDQAMGGAKLVRIYRALLDGDGDGQSAFFGGPDCDDGNPAIYNGADEVKDNGIDENCDGRDRVSKKEEPEAVTGTGAGTGTGTGALAKDLNVVVVMIDTVRADRLGVAGYQRDGKSLTPRIDALVGESTWFTRAYSQASNTPRAMPAFMTSRYPSTIHVDKLFKNYPTLHDDNVMLFEALQGAGYETYGYSSHFYFREERNFTQGFTLYDNEGALDIAPSNKDSASPRIVPKVTAKLAELGQAKKKFAMWVHLFEPHSTYMEHEGWPITERGTAGLVQKYDYEIAFVDGYVGQILDSLAASGLAESTIVVVVADHGEAFGTHTFAGQKMFFHGQTLYDELLRIPLVVRVPGRPAGQSDALVQLIDVAPTVLDAVGVALPPSFQGRSLVPALRGEPLAGKPAFAELIPYPSWNHEGRAVISADGRWKLFDRVSDGRKELYDLAEDPEEKKDRFRDDTAKAQELEDLLLDFADLRKAASR